MKYKFNPKSLKNLTKSEQSFCKDPKVAQAILSPESNKKIDIATTIFMLKTRGILPKDYNFKFNRKRD